MGKKNLDGVTAPAPCAESVETTGAGVIQASIPCGAKVNLDAVHLDSTGAGSVLSGAACAGAPPPTNGGNSAATPDGLHLSSKDAGAVHGFDNIKNVVTKGAGAITFTVGQTDGAGSSTGKGPEDGNVSWKSKMCWLG